MGLCFGKRFLQISRMCAIHEVIFLKPFLAGKFVAFYCQLYPDFHSFPIFIFLVSCIQWQYLWSWLWCWYKMSLPLYIMMYSSFGIPLVIDYANDKVIEYAIDYLIGKVNAQWLYFERCYGICHLLLKEPPGLQRIRSSQEHSIPWFSAGLLLFTRLKVSSRNVCNQYIRIFTN